MSLESADSTTVRDPFQDVMSNDAPSLQVELEPSCECPVRIQRYLWYSSEWADAEKLCLEPW